MAIVYDLEQKYNDGMLCVEMLKPPVKHDHF